MRFDFLGLEAFLAVAELGSFTRAARRLNLTQTAVSHRIRKLEEGLQAELLSRTTREVTLTRAGSHLLPSLRRTMVELTHELDAVRGASSEASESVAIACLPTIAGHRLGPAIRAFSKRRPGVRVRIFDRSASEIGELVTSGDVEFGVTVVAANSQQTVARPLFTEEYYVVCPARHRLARAAHVNWSDLKDERLVRVGPETANRYIIDQALGSAIEAHQWAFEVQHSATARELVRSGVALTIAPASVTGAISGDEIAAIPLRRPRVSRTIGILSLRSATFSDTAAELASEIERALGHGRSSKRVTAAPRRLRPS